MAINDVLPLPHFDGFIYIRYAAPPYSAFISAIYLLPFDTVWFGSLYWPCATPGNEEFTEGARSPSAKSDNEVDTSIYVGWVKMAVQFKVVCGPKFVSLWDNVANPL